MEQKNYTITEEQLNSIESEVMTRDALSLIVNEVRLTKPVAPDTKATALLTQCLKVLEELDPEGRCRLYELDNHYCNSQCPFGSKHYDGWCGIRLTKSDLKLALGGY